MVTLLPIFAFGLIIALSLIITRKPPSIPPWGEAATGAWAIIILYVNITSYSSPKGEVGRGLFTYYRHPVPDRDLPRPASY